jgi:hypothetical protein
VILRHQPVRIAASRAEAVPEHVRAVRAVSGNDQVDALGDEPEAENQASRDDRLVGMGVDPGPEPVQERLALVGSDNGVDLSIARHFDVGVADRFSHVEDPWTRLSWDDLPMATDSAAPERSQSTSSSAKRDHAADKHDHSSQGDDSAGREVTFLGAIHI